ncbi:MAG TPA: tetratricopeptide repeat protein [Candidatus Hydrothermia bacterium]|nr:tetratricopeptide repeat protein [Candidatus Hydrothermae bacterium]MDD3649402.1 tetratricopeptide repeat protein [Candidatus Hydrothermia bacterium]HRD23336.1 tetratricopeptide repeat protein [Candidatus Hydrothermia bacterium]
MAKEVKRARKEELRHDPIREAIVAVINFFKRASKTKYFRYFLYGLGGLLVIIILVVIYNNANKPRASTEADFALIQAIVSISQQDTVNAPQLLQQLTTTYRSTSSGMRAFYYSGVYYQKIGDPKTALEYYKKFLSTKIEDNLLRTFAYANLSDIYVDMNNLDKALSYINKAEKLAPTESLKAYYWYKTARVYYLKGNVQKAKEMLAEFKEKFPESSISSVVNEELQFLKGMLGEVN